MSNSEWRVMCIVTAKRSVDPPRLVRVQHRWHASSLAADLILDG
jgi:hypothetical protein